MARSPDKPREAEARGPARDKETIGWREWLALPDLGVPRIKAKVDTGARSSALHAFDLERLSRGGCDRVRFTIHPLQRDVSQTAVAEAEVVEDRLVTNSGGGQELRPVIETRIALLGRVWTIELTLTRRDVMGFRMLLGRQAVRGRLLIDPGRSFVAGRARRKKKRQRRG